EGKGVLHGTTRHGCVFGGQRTAVPGTHAGRETLPELLAAAAPGLVLFDNGEKTMNLSTLNLILAFVAYVIAYLLGFQAGRRASARSAREASRTWKCGTCQNKIPVAEGWESLYNTHHRRHCHYYCNEGKWGRRV